MATINAQLSKTLGRFFVNEYYNHIYNLAKTTTPADGSITKTYIAKCSAYMIAVKEVKQVYCKLVTGLHGFMINVPAFSNWSYNEMVDRLIQAFVPRDYYDALSKEHKDEFLSSVLCDIVSTMTSVCIKNENLIRIIDERRGPNKDVALGVLLREAMIAIENKRESLTQEFVRAVGQVKDTIPVEQARRLQDRVDELTAENSDLYVKIEELTIREAKMKKLVDLLQKQRIIIYKEGEQNRKIAASVKSAPKSIPKTVPSIQKQRLPSLRTPVPHQSPRESIHEEEDEAEADADVESEASTSPKKTLTTANLKKHSSLVSDETVDDSLTSEKNGNNNILNGFLLQD